MTAMRSAFGVCGAPAFGLRQGSGASGGDISGQKKSGAAQFPGLADEGLQCSRSPGTLAFVTGGASR